MDFRTPLRLIAAPDPIESSRSHPADFHSRTVNAPVHRFEELIGGRAYLIEVAPVSVDRWRAYIVRVPGVPTALMPFYGRTPGEAAQSLSSWLSRAYGTIAPAAAPTAAPRPV